MADNRPPDQPLPLPTDTRDLVVDTLNEAKRLIKIADEFKNGVPPLGGSGHEETDAVTPSGELPPSSVCDQLTAAMDRALRFVQQNLTLPEEVIRADVKLVEGAGRYAVLQILRFFWRGITNVQPKSTEFAAELKDIQDHLDRCQEMVPKIEDYVSQAADLCTQIMQRNGHDRSLQLAFDNVTRRADLELSFCEERLKKAEKKLNDLVKRVKTRKRDEGKGMTLIGSAAVLSAAGTTGALYACKALTKFRATILCSLTAIGVGLLLLNRADQNEYEKLLSELRNHRTKSEQLQTKLEELKRRLDSEVDAVATLQVDEGMRSPEPTIDQSEQGPVLLGQAPSQSDVVSQTSQISQQSNDIEEPSGNE